MDSLDKTVLEPISQQINISVIMPAYNCGLIICDTMNSIINQSLKNIEIIIINDGSTDNTLDVLNQFKDKDDRIKIITVENGGPANARNIGIKQAIGEYLYFVDSDDIIAQNMLFDMYSLAINENLDVCACGYVMESVGTKNTHVKEFLFEDFVVKTKTEFREKLMPLIKAHLMYVVWNKLFKSSFIRNNNIMFNDYLSGEDRLFNAHTFKNIQSFGFINKPYYRYFLRGQASLANRYVNNRFDAALMCHKEFIKAYTEMELYTDQNKAYLEFVFIKGIMSCITQLNSKGCPLNYKGKLEYIKSLMENEYVKAAINSSDDEISYSNKINKILRTGNKPLIYLTSKAIFIMQFKLNSLYLNIKHKLK